MSERDYCKDKRKKEENSAVASAKAIALNKNYNFLKLPCDGGKAWEKKRDGYYDPRDFDTVWKKADDDRYDDRERENESTAEGKAAIFNKNINFVLKGSLLQ